MIIYVYYTHIYINRIFNLIFFMIGIKLLKSMGWREGQGIGARVHRKGKFI